MTQLLAESSHWHHHSWFLLWPLAWVLLFSLLALFVFRRRGGSRHWAAASAAPDPRAILAERFARGEIDHDEYRERLGHLEP